MKVRSHPRGSARLVMFLALTGLFALGSAGVWLLNGDKPRERTLSPSDARPVRRGGLRIVLRRRGTFEAAVALKVRAKVRGRARIVSLVPEGTIVKKGDVLMELDKTDVLADIETLEAQVERAQANLVAAEADQIITDLDCESKTRKAQMDVEMALLEIEKFEQGVKPKEERDAQIKIDQAEVRYKNAVEVHRLMPDMLKQGFVTKEDFKQSELTVQTAKNAWETAKLEREILLKYTHPMRAKQLAANLRQARSELRRFEQVAKRRRAQTEAAVTQRQQELRRARERLRDARERCDRMTLRAPGDGIVVYGGGYRWGWRREREDIRVGGEVWRDQVVMRLPDLNTLQIALNIHEADFNKIRVDEKNPQPARITVDSIPGRAFRGHVKKIATLAHSEWGRDKVKLFTTIIALEKQIPGMRPGMTADVEIFVKELRDVLYVPVQAVHTRRGRVFCYVLRSDGGYETREVEIGASNDSFVQIRKGLEEGEKVLVVTPEVEAGEASGRGPTPTPASSLRRRRRSP